MRVIRNSAPTSTAKKQLVSDYEIAGRVHRNTFDVAVVPPKKAAIIQLFHHVLVLPDAEESYDQAAALARRWIDVREKSGNHKSLTAVFYGREDASVSPPSDAAALLKHDKIQAASLDDLAEIAGELEPQRKLFHVRVRGLRSRSRRRTARPGR